MKKVFILVCIFAVVGFVLASGGKAQALTYTETVDIYQIISTGADSYPDSVSWVHNYTLGLPIASASLTITAEDVDSGGESIGVSFNSNDLGSLNNQGFYSSGPVTDITPGPGVTGPPTTALSTTIFNLYPSWILTASNVIAIELLDNWWAEIETATLTVETVPEPSTVFLLGIGLAGVGLLRKRFKR